MLCDGKSGYIDWCHWTQQFAGLASLSLTVLQDKSSCLGDNNPRFIMCLQAYHFVVSLNSKQNSVLLLTWEIPIFHVEIT